MPYRALFRHPNGPYEMRKEINCIVIVNHANEFPISKKVEFEGQLKLKVHVIGSWKAGFFGFNSG